MSLDSDSSVGVWTNSWTCCKPVCRMRWLKNKGAVLIVLWSFLVIHVYFFLKAGNIVSDKNISNAPMKTYNSGIILLCITLLFPVGGWIADARLGRYKTVRYSMWMMWIAAILATLGEVVAYVSVTYNAYIKVWVFRALCVVMTMGLGGFQSNIVQLGTDQLIDASANEISSFIFWYILVMNISGLNLSLVSDCVSQEYKMTIVNVLLVAVCLTIAVCSDFLFKRCLIEDQVIRKSLREVWKIIWYMIKNRKIRYDFADNDDGDQIPSQFDIAKHQYGGPFTGHEVDNVRTFLWILAILATCGIVFGSIIAVEYAREEVQHRWSGYNDTESWSRIRCYRKLFLKRGDCIIVVILGLSYEFIIRPFFYRCLPKGRIVSKFIVGTVFLLLLILSLLSIEVVAFSKESVISNYSSVECIFDEKIPEIKFDQKWLLIPDVFGGIAHFILNITAIEFIWAQTPSTMKGLMFGCGYAILGLNTFLHGVIAVPFLFKIRYTFNWHPLSCGIWYLIMEGAITLAVLIGIMVLVRYYKNRK